MRLGNLLKIRIHNCMLSKCPLSLQVHVEDFPSCPHAPSRYHSFLLALFPSIIADPHPSLFLAICLHSLLHASGFPTILTGPPSLRLWLRPPTSPKSLILFPYCMPAWCDFSVMVSRPLSFLPCLIPSLPSPFGMAFLQSRLLISCLSLIRS